MKNTLDESRPIYLQIKAYIADSILNGSMKIGERVPSTNELAKFYNINPATARQGMTELVNEEILRKQRGVGMFVTEEAKNILIAGRKKDFYQDYIKPLKREAEKLEISNQELLQMMEKEELNNED